ncbi:IclR family transcriptional regulator [Arthrobacter sp. Marseille-P9274]|uniref:IclR family transcriptional regulator n=1 Tax=Arthrobacter sp. Marseille-P9274 TaxID=2866572 RepID=UPI0021C964E2|nr:IclR family transcriptional regulator [Arthrobacter sp. Marseille-P9274]
MAGNNSMPGQSVSSKTFLILEAFAGERTVLSMSEIARATGLPSSTAHRLIQSLVSWGGLERTAGGEYAIGVRLWEIAARANRTYGLRETAMPFLQGLWETTKAHVLLAVLEGSEALLIERIAGTRDVPVAGRAGGRLPLHASSSGKILLAHGEPAVRDAALSRPLAAFTPRTITDREELQSELDRVRRDGVATSLDELTAGSASCAAPVFGPPEIGVAAVSLLSSPGARDLAEMKILVQMAGRGLSHALAGNRGAASISPRLRRRVKP